MNYVSLGYLCGIANCLRIMQLRKKSYPFDWIISEFKSIIELIENNFIDFLNEDFLFQSKDNLSWYKNTKYNLIFKHDFKDDVSFFKQIDKIKDKYERRIKRFFDDIKQPTIFIRYINTENNDLSELKFIEDNIDMILSLIKSFNIKNKIIFICDEIIKIKKIELLPVKPDYIDGGIRKASYPLFQIKYFIKKSKTANYSDVVKNTKKMHIYKFIWNSFKAIKKIFKKKYIHNKQY